MSVSSVGLVIKCSVITMSDDSRAGVDKAGERARRGPRRHPNSCPHVLLGQFVLILALVALAAPAWAACSGVSPNLTSSSANLVDVSACLAAAANGDTISVPAGSATWTTSLTITKFVKLVAAAPVTITDNSVGGDPDAGGGGPSLISI